jgi:hypothetical protein
MIFDEISNSTSTGCESGSSFNANDNPTLIPINRANMSYSDRNDNDSLRSSINELKEMIASQDERLRSQDERLRSQDERLQSQDRQLQPLVYEKHLSESSAIVSGLV